MGIPWKKILVACVAAAAVTACSRGNTGASAPPASEESVVTLSPETNDANNKGAVQIGAKTVSCAKGEGIELNVGAAKKGFSGKLITVKVENKVTIIDWGGEGAYAIIVDDQKWAHADGNKTPMPTKTKLLHDQWGKPTKIVICNFGN